jgi:hypothetical protein
MKNWPRWRNLTWATASQSHRMCVADSSSSRHLSQMGSSVNPNLKRCPFRWQCPVSSPTTHLNWFLLSLDRSFVLLAEGPCISPFASGVMILSSVYGCVTDNNGFWIGWLDLLTPSFTISCIHSNLTITQNKCLTRTRCIVVSLCSDLNYGWLLIYGWLHSVLYYDRRSVGQSILE